MSTSTAPQLRVQIRWLIRRDMPYVLEIERACFDPCWDEEDFLVCLRRREVIGMVAEYGDHICGFMLYELHKSKLRVLNFAVAPWAQRKGVGTALIRRLQDKLSQQRRQWIVLNVRESNLRMQLFLRSLGFKCTDILRGWYDDNDESAYEFLYRLRQSAECEGV